MLSSRLRLVAGRLMEDLAGAWRPSSRLQVLHLSDCHNGVCLCFQIKRRRMQRIWIDKPIFYGSVLSAH